MPISALSRLFTAAFNGFRIRSRQILLAFAIFLRRNSDAAEKHTVEGARAGKPGGKADLGDGKIGGKQHFDRLLNTKRVDIIAKTDAQLFIEQPRNVKLTQKQIL